MKLDEFAFVNQQLAGMLQSGIPLEGALRQLCLTMRRGRLRTELGRLEADLAQGTPLEKALAAGDLPPFYVAMVRVGVASGDLPGVLTLLADHYHQVNSVWVRLKGLMVYPMIVLVAAFGLSLGLSIIFGRVMREVTGSGFDLGLGRHDIGPGTEVVVWIAPCLLALVLGTLAVGLMWRRSRAWLRWRLPGFREASLARLASSFHVLLERGATLNEALDLMRRLEADSIAGRELAVWQERLSQGVGRIEDFAEDAKAFPKLFIWLAANGGQNLAAGFRRAAELYQARAAHRIEMMLYACLPVSVLLLGLMILGQVYPLVRVFIAFNSAMTDMGDY